MAKRVPVPGLLSYADLMEIFSCSRPTVYRMWKKLKKIPAPHEVEGLGPRWWEDEIIAYLAAERSKSRQAVSQENPKK